MVLIINADKVILGRLATYAAKAAILGETVKIINVENAIITGTKTRVMTMYKERTQRGSMKKGPFLSRTPEQFVKRAIRGMLPYKQAKGLRAFKRIMCYKGTPQEFEGKETLNLEKHTNQKLKTLDFGTVGTICKELGGKQ